MAKDGSDRAASSFRERLRSGDRVIGGWCTLPSSFAAEIVSNSGVDYAVVDMQHGLAGYSDLVAMLQAIGSVGITPLVRIPLHDFGGGQRALDAGAYGLIFPMIDTVAQARMAAAAVRYPPLGERSYGPIRSRFHLGTEPNSVNSDVLCLVQVETPLAVQNIEDILSTDGIDGVYVGPADLSLSHGLPMGADSAGLDTLLVAIADACRRHDRIPGIHTTSGADCRRAFDLGYQFCSVGSDAVWLRSEYSRQVAAARSASGGGAEGAY